MTLRGWDEHLIEVAGAVHGFLDVVPGYLLDCSLKQQKEQHDAAPSVIILHAAAAGTR